MAAHRFNPDHPGAVAYAFPGGPLLRAGDVADLTDEQVNRLRSICGDCLIPVNPGAGAAADFIAAISAPTPHNPETPVNPADVTPIKRGRKARSEA